MSEEKATGQLTERLKTIGELFADKRKSFEEVASRYTDPDKLIRVALIAIRREPKLLNCTQLSLLEALIDASRLGLEIGLAGQAYLVPFKAEAVLIPGYRGLILTATRSGMAKVIEAHEVYEKDEFDYWYGNHPDLVHKPYKGDDPGDIVAAYARAILPDGERMFEVTPGRTLAKVKKVSKAASLPDSIWKVWEEEMSRKTPVRRLFKYLPSKPEGEAVLEHDNATMGTLFEAPELKEPQRLEIAGAGMANGAEAGTPATEEKAEEQKGADPGPAQETRETVPGTGQNEPAEPKGRATPEGSRIPPKKKQEPAQPASQGNGKPSPYLRVRDLLRQLGKDEKWLGELYGSPGPVKIIDLPEGILPDIIARLEKAAEEGVAAGGGNAQA